jgi:hypothetical protein
MSQRKLLVVLLMMGLSSLSLAGESADPVHPSQQPALNIEATFPRCSEADLAAAGYPDRMHMHWWPDWEVMTDEDGVTYGPGAFCNRKILLEHEGLSVQPGSNSYGRFITHQNAKYKPCDLMLLLEYMDWADHVLPEMLGLFPEDTLKVISPDNLESYKQVTGQDIWRLYKLKDNTCIIEPFGILQARTLDTHAVFMFVTDWLLSENLPVRLPAWLHYGLVEYMSENGVHLTNYMGEFRHDGDILFSPAIINVILSQPPDSDLDRDRTMYRRACYSAFLMAWELVENRGGVKTLREFLVLVREGVELDKASQKIYGMTMEELAISLDPVVLGEPIGQKIQSRRPALQPTIENSEFQER